MLNSDEIINIFGIVDELKNICQIEHARHRSFATF